ncbi:MAG: hypothetical protein LBG97_08940 [Coriobacteriales bacterium]|jgi:hypothetical protein|nr:hypothetical protein [Coriobacteriales bacterium]
MFGAIISERGAVPVIEATFVFPITFLVLAVLLMVGNAYYLKARVEAGVSQFAQDGAAYVAAPLLEGVLAGNAVPSFTDANGHAKPYRYLAGIFTGNSAAVGNVESGLSTYLNNNAQGLFPTIELDVRDVDVKYNGSVIYPTVSVDVSYEVVIPIRLFGQDAPFAISMASHSEVMVSDMSEFIRNMDAAAYYMKKSGLSDEIAKWAEKAKELLFLKNNT